jgi:outer membrane protein W
MKTKSVLIIILLANILFAQTGEKKFYINANYIYTTTAKLYLQPNSSDPFIRGTHEDLEDLWSYSGEIGYSLSEEIIIAIGLEYVEKTFVNHNMNLGGTRAVMTDGFKVIPLELSLYYTLPFSTEMFKFFMGGGGGLYFGTHIRRLGDVSVSNESRKVGYGIQVAVGMDYLFNEYFSIRAQMRFRDPEFEMKSSYSNKVVNYGGRTFLLSNQTFSSKVNIDGISFAIGLVFRI